MKKKETILNFIKAAVFLLLGLYLTVHLTYMLRTNGIVKDIFNGFYAMEEESVDVVLIGSSPVYPFYSAAKLYGDTGITAYPLSSNVQRPEAAIPLVKEAMKTQIPELFVFEMRMYTMKDGDMMTNMAYSRGVTDNLKYSLNRMEAVQRMVPIKSERLSYYLDLMKYHSNWKTLIYPDQWKTFFYNKKSPLLGFPIENEIGPLEVDRIPTCTDLTETEPIPEEQEERLIELLNYLQENGLKAAFIVSPYRLEEPQMRMCNYMEELIEGYGYTFTNMNQHYEEIGIDFLTDYYDFGGHVNLKGAVKCTDYLEQLLSAYDLTDHRAAANKGQADPKYQAYEKAYQLYLETEQETIKTIQEKIENQDFLERE